MFRRVVSAKFKDSATERDIKEYIDAVLRLAADIPEIKHLSRGLQVSDGDDSRAYSHVAIFEFETFEALQSFVKNPVHRAATPGILRVVDERVIVNYEA